MVTLPEPPFIFDFFNQLVILTYDKIENVSTYVSRFVDALDEEIVFEYLVESAALCVGPSCFPPNSWEIKVTD